MAATPRALFAWAVIGEVAALVLYAVIAGWPPSHPLPFVAGVILVVVWLVLVFPTQEYALRYRKLGAVSGSTMRALLLCRGLSLLARASIAGTLLLQRGSLSWGFVVAVLLLAVCDDPVKRYADRRALDTLKDDVEAAGGMVRTEL